MGKNLNSVAQADLDLLSWNGSTSTPSPSVTGTTMVLDVYIFYIFFPRKTTTTWLLANNFKGVVKQDLKTKDSGQFKRK